MSLVYGQLMSEASSETSYLISFSRSFKKSSSQILVSSNTDDYIDERLLSLNLFLFGETLSS